MLLSDACILRCSDKLFDPVVLCFQGNKRCASCKTRKTPLWRNAEDGTSLCNACGIRYKKYRIRCFQCWNIPKHGGKRCLHCSNCGGKLHAVTAHQKSGK
ncbi:GATA-type zinc finger protein 1, partial [Varanus komodoensis]